MKQVIEYLENLLKKDPNFTGNLQINIVSGTIKDVNEVKRIKFATE
jgi:hypothetical protein